MDLFLHGKHLKALENQADIHGQGIYLCEKDFLRDGMCFKRECKGEIVLILSYYNLAFRRDLLTLVDL